MSAAPILTERWRVRAQRRQEAHAQALARPATAIPYVGDPRIVLPKGQSSPDPIQRFITLYAAAVAIKHGMLPQDASGIDAFYEAPGTVIFVRADASQTEVCRCTVACEVAA